MTAVSWSDIMPCLFLKIFIEGIFIKFKPLNIGSKKHKDTTQLSATDLLKPSASCDHQLRLFTLYDYDDSLFVIVVNIFKAMFTHERGLQ